MHVHAAGTAPTRQAAPSTAGRAFAAFPEGATRGGKGVYGVFKRRHAATDRVAQWVQRLSKAQYAAARQDAVRRFSKVQHAVTRQGAAFIEGAIRGSAAGCGVFQRRSTRWQDAAFPKGAIRGGRMRRFPKAPRGGESGGTVGAAFIEGAIRGGRMRRFPKAQYAAAGRGAAFPEDATRGSAAECSVFQRRNTRRRIGRCGVSRRRHAAADRAAKWAQRLSKAQYAAAGCGVSRRCNTRWRGRVQRFPKAQHAAANRAVRRFPKTQHAAAWQGAAFPEGATRGSAAVPTRQAALL